MFKKSRCKIMILSILLVIPLMLGSAANVLANGVEPPKPGEAIFIADAELIGDLTLEWGSFFVPGFWAAFVGTCYNLDDDTGRRQNFPFYIEPSFFPGDPNDGAKRFVEATEDELMVAFDSDAVKDCFGEEAAGAVITAVKKFSNSGLEINARVTIWGLVTTPPE